MTPPLGGPTVSLASFNVHCGVDGWGRPFDVVGECAALDTDLLVLQESWAPDDGRPSTAAAVADRLGYPHLVEAPMAHGRLFGPDPTADGRWGPPRGPDHDTLRLDGHLRGRARALAQRRPYGTGRFGVALLSRVPLATTGRLDLGKLPRDPAGRVVITASVTVGDRSLEVLGTHMSHLLYRSPVQYLRLRRLVPTTDRPAVLAGDMNLWGPGVTTFLTGWRRAVRGRTWPSWRPHSQLDHVLVTPPVTVVDARVVPGSGSDHRPVRVTLSLG
jgi:endonuclease/exonuclease/phosphatase family metal-dependent hydrolase